MMDCECLVGYNGTSDGAACTACEGGYKNETGVGVCAACPAGTGSALGSVALDNCTCLAGYILQPTV